MTSTVAERPRVASTGTAGAAGSDGWPLNAAQVPAWAAGFGPELAVYLQPLGTILVAVTGDPVALEASARNWDGVHAVAGRVQAELVAGEPLLQGTTGEARHGADRLRRRLHQDFTQVSAQAQSIASTLRIAGQDVVESRRMVIEVIRSFLSQAEVRRQAAVVAASSGATTARADYLTALGVLFDAHHPHAVEIYRNLSERMEARADAWNAMSPSLLARLWDRTKEFFTEDVRERLHDVVGTRGFQSGVVDLGVGSAVDAFWNDPRLRTSLQGGGTYAGGNLTAADCAKIAGATALRVQYTPVKLGLGTLASACGVVHAAGAAGGLEPVGQVVVGWGKDAGILPEGVALRGGLRTMDKAGSSLFAGRSIGGSAQLGGDPDVRFGCTDFAVATGTVPRRTLALNTGGWATYTPTNDKVAAGGFAEVELNLFSSGGANGWYAISPSGVGRILLYDEKNLGTPYCGVYYNLPWR